MDAAGTVADALAIEADRIVAVGSASELAARFAGPATELLNVGGRMVLPGFIDAHVHFELTALSLAQSVDCRTVGSISELIERLRERAARTAAGQWVVGQGVFFQDTRIVEGRYPDRHDLDKVSTEHPVLVRFSFHVAVLNSHALALCRVSRDTPDPQGGEVQRDEAGEPTGMTRDMVHHLGLPPPRVEEVRTALATVGRQRLLANGVTTIQEISGHFLVGPYQASQRTQRIKQEMWIEMLLEIFILHLGFFFFQSLVDLRRVQLFVSAVLDRSDARPLLDDHAHDDAALSAIGFDADVVKEPGLPEVQKVFLDQVGVVRLARNDAEVDADRVAGDGRVPDGLESLDRLTGQDAGRRHGGGGCGCRF